MSEHLNEGCHLQWEPSVAGNKPSPQEKVILFLLLAKEISLDDLARATRLSREQILGEIKTLRKEYGVRGNKRIGYSLSNEPLERLSMSRHLSDLEDIRSGRKLTSE